MSEEGEIELGREAAAQVEQSMGFAGSAELNAYLTRIGQRLAKHSSRSHLDYEFHVVDMEAAAKMAVANDMTTEERLAGGESIKNSKRERYQDPDR
jgi:hypothetical protein